MSFPPNRLAQYRTYSYHQFLAVCSSTEAAESLGNVSDGDFSKLNHPSVDRIYTPRPTAGGQYILLVDGMSDAHLNITKSTWSTSIIPDSKSASGAHAGLGMAVSGVIEVYEPNGAGFINIIGSAAQSMNVPFPSLSFMLKTVFIGETHEGETVYVTDVNPFVFFLYDMSAVFDSTGSKYRLQIMGQVGSGMKQDSQVLSGSGIKVKKDEQLDALLGRVATLANTEVDKANAELLKVDPAAAATTKKPKYKIVVTDELKEKIAGDNIHIRLANANKNPVLNLSQNGASTVAGAIEAVLMSSRAVVEDAKSGEPEANIIKRKMFTINEATSVVNGETVHTYYVGVRDTLTAKQGVDMSKEAADLTFDYIFTGRNTDIINLDMKLTHALNVVMALSTTNATPAAINAQVGNADDTVVGGDLAQSSGGTATSPNKLVVGHNFQQPHYGNMNYPSSTANYYHLLSKQAEFDSVGAVITIHGNPRLLGEMTVNPTQMAAFLKDVPTKGGTGINANWLRTPTKLRLNVKFPSNPDDVTAGFTDFWYLGLYRMMEIEHTFKNGKFTQTISVSPITGSTPSFDGSEPSGGTAGQARSSARVSTKSGTGTQRDSGVLAVTSEAASKNFSDLRPLIERIAAEEGVDPNIMLALTKQESSYDTSAIGPYVGGYCGQAIGLMQLCPRTAEGEGIPRSDLLIPEQNMRAGSRYYKRMLNRFGTQELALAAYNAGPTAVVNAGNQIPNIPETQNYVEKISRYRDQFATKTSPEDRKAAKIAATAVIKNKLVKTIDDAEKRSVKFIKDASSNTG